MEEDQFSYMPSYWEIIRGVYDGYVETQRQWGNPPLSTAPGVFWRCLLKFGAFDPVDILYIVVLAVMWTMIRYLLTWTVLTPFARWVQMTSLNQKKFPESAWKALFYSCTWLYSCYVLLWCGEFDYFQRPLAIWQDWAPGMEVPTLVYIMYMVQLSFYLHSVYGTLFMDHKRKDTLVMLFHHFLTMSLIGFSYACRYHKIGTLVLFTHDITDIALEITKCNVYMKNRGGKYYALHEYISQAGFTCFAVGWALFRLYWYPLKCLYSAGYASVMYNPSMKLPFHFFFNSMLWILMVLNIYWFMFIVNFLYKVATGQMNEVDDVREEEVEEQVMQKMKSKQNNVKAGGDFKNNDLSPRRRSARTQGRKDD
ncbi:ceramide synthase 1 [Lingula anatina]|uniref:Ceramide synthase 1 n=1 Tax=Lingula anatina TaxID=7574 RepID=A0A1S3JMN5_LINAN|nr:ceramide synthase 1 [Lingula anatina]|eukprot:XP_013411633.1 ceramide synthase 1 [Lingula anatina]